jgi:uncharacterized protein (DUF1501 family)
MMLTRRRFLANSCAAGVASAVAPLVASQAAVPQIELPGYRAAVCILLSGGNDSFNMLVPTSRDQHRAYQSARENLALDAKSLLQVNGLSSDGHGLGLHPGMPELRDLYAKGELAFLTNVGTLQRPFSAGSPQPLAEDLLSHSGQIKQWQTCHAESATSGWAGRLADLMHDSACDSNVAMNLSVSGPNVLQLGNTSSTFAIAPQGRRDQRIPAGVDFGFVNNQMTSRLANIGRPGAVKHRALRQNSAQITTQAALEKADGLEPALSTMFASDPFSQRLAEVTRLIAARNTLGSRRQTFFVNFDGWDHHHDLLSNQTTMLPMLSQGLQSFRDALLSMGVYDDVTTFTISEFGRSLASNGSGSDHGWAGHQIMLGGSVKGGNIYGTYPDLSASSEFHIGDGVYAPSTSTDEYFAELALWLGVPPSRLNDVLPNLPAFYKASVGSPPLGFLV